MTCNYCDIQVAPCTVEQVIGDDWTFSFTANSIGLYLLAPADLTGYTPGGDLYLPNSETYAAGVDGSQLSVGKFVLSVPESVTINFLPDDTAYRLRVYLVDPSGFKHTYMIVPLKVILV